MTAIGSGVVTLIVISLTLSQLGRTAMNALETVKFAGWMLIGALAYVSTITIGAFAAAASGPLTAFSDNALYIVAGGFGIAAACAFFAPPGLALLRTRF